MCIVRQRRALTLTEVLVSIGIIGLLLGLILPAVQRVRAAAARTECINHLHQIGIAFQQYSHDRGRLPTGVGPVSGPGSDQPYMNWHTALLPYLEQPTLWQQALAAYKANPVFTKDPPHTARAIPLAIFSCPADSRLTAPAIFSGQLFALTSYLGVDGRSAVREDGVLFMGSQVRLADITDGTSQTLLVGERPPSTDLRMGWWYAGHGQMKTGEGDGVLGVRTSNFTTYLPDCPDGPYHFVPGSFSNQCDRFHFWSPHSGGAYFLLADGSSRFLTYDVDPILPALASRAGGEAETMPD